MKAYIYSFLIISLIACKKEEYPFNLPKNAKEILAGKSGKTWKIAWRYNDGVRMNMTGCFLTYKIKYFPEGVMEDNNGEQENCGPSLKGNWEIITNNNKKSYIKWTSDSLQEIMNTRKNRKYFKILQLEKDTLKLQYRHKQFSSESTFIDTFVPEHMNVKDRNYHW
ncbi:hypothetical protein U6A24_09420 [Aquimarina gracilis]|uniref:Lipocalin-like protein n=1 Tax=Aquimarina gracilis TaxID=874422 RepID=A0ABU5ZUK4_9FLAO|nr:hypothetical protein [Aquimarina gracilis]MEB3345679.1 hypothetical protein [Aquimarina gracilis]